MDIAICIPLALLYGACALLLIHGLGFQLHMRTIKNSESFTSPIDIQDGRSGPSGQGSSADRLTISQQYDEYKEMYFKLQNVEQHPEVMPRAKHLLLAFLSEAILCAHAQHSAILAIERFSPSAIAAFMRRELDHITHQWQQYLQRRKEGHARELFLDADAAKRWLVKKAPVKLVDGAWLGQVHTVGIPFAYRSITKDAWQVLSEELGDGDLEKNHVHVYQKLIRQIGVDLPAADSAEFIQAMDNDPCIWKGAIAQLLIALFPSEFLPETLGFNMHFEMLTLETMVAATELREVHLDPSYFNLHISIDNADSGHMAMASHIVMKYLSTVQAVEGADAAQQAWKRVQAGFVLSKHLPSHQRSFPNQGPLAIDLMKIFQAKSVACHRLHDNCRVKLGGQSLSTWLNPDHFQRERWQTDFLDCLSNDRLWVRKGDSASSRLVQQCVWGGPMFGAFTDSEVATIKNWIDSLAPNSPLTYWHFIGWSCSSDESQVSASGQVNLETIFRDARISPSHLPPPIRSIDLSSVPILHKLIPLWFVHPCLLESCLRVPVKTTNSIGCSVVRLLRAQYGFDEITGIAGMDEIRRAGWIDLIEIGMEIISHVEDTPSKPKDVADVLERWPSAFAETMLALAVRPQQWFWSLLGLTQAFVHLHHWLALSPLLSRRTRAIVHRIALQEQVSLDTCMKGLQEQDLAYEDFWKGYELGRVEIDGCFEKRKSISSLQSTMRKGA